MARGFHTSHNTPVVCMEDSAGVAGRLGWNLKKLWAAESRGRSGIHDRSVVFSDRAEWSYPDDWAQVVRHTALSECTPLRMHVRPCWSCLEAHKKGIQNVVQLPLKP